MNIGVDLDGVLFDTENYYRTLSMIYEVENNGSGEIDREALFFKERFGWSMEKSREFLRNTYVEVLENSSIMHCAKYVINKLKEKGHKLYIITARGSVIKEEIPITEKKLKEEGLEFDGYYYASKNKAQVCKDLKIDVMIDDHYDNIEKISNEKIKCLYYRDLVLRFIDNEQYVHEVRNWGDIYKEILNFDSWK